MLTPVDLDDEFSREANEIDDVAPDGGLPAELTAVNLPAPQSRPEAAFRIGQVLPEFSGMLFDHDAIIPPTLALPHKGRGEVFGPAQAIRIEEMSPRLGMVVDHAHKPLEQVM